MVDIDKMRDWLEEDWPKDQEQLLGVAQQGADMLTDCLDELEKLRAVIEDLGVRAFEAIGK